MLQKLFLDNAIKGCPTGNFSQLQLLIFLKLFFLYIVKIISFCMGSVDLNFQLSNPMFCIKAL